MLAETGKEKIVNYVNDLKLCKKLMQKRSVQCVVGEDAVEIGDARLGVPPPDEIEDLGELLKVLGQGVDDPTGVDPKAARLGVAGPADNLK